MKLKYFSVKGYQKKQNNSQWKYTVVPLTCFRATWLWICSHFAETWEGFNNMLSSKAFDINFSTTIQRPTEISLSSIFWDPARALKTLMFTCIFQKKRRTKVHQIKHRGIFFAFNILQNVDSNVDQTTADKVRNSSSQMKETTRWRAICGRLGIIKRCALLKVFKRAKIAKEKSDFL